MATVAHAGPASGPAPPVPVVLPPLPWPAVPVLPPVLPVAPPVPLPPLLLQPWVAANIPRAVSPQRAIFNCDLVPSMTFSFKSFPKRHP